MVCASSLHVASRADKCGARIPWLQGETFDKSFANTMVSDHEADIKEYEKVQDKADAVGAYAKETLPTLKHHLEMAQKLKTQVDAPTTGSGTTK